MSKTIMNARALEKLALEADRLILANDLMT
jgi:hypothetical protein